MTSQDVDAAPAKVFEPVRADVVRAMESMELMLREREALRVKTEQQEHELIDVRARLDAASSALRVAEISRDTYMESSTEAVARLDGFARQLRDIGAAVAEALIDAKNAPYRPRTPQVQPALTPDDEERVQSLARKLAPVENPQ